MPPRPPTPRRSRRPESPKLQRWIDLLAALLSRTFPATFDDLCRDVPAYRNATPGPTLMRMFERDKDELRAFGVAIETVKGKDDSAQDSYRLRRTDFYLPFLAVAQSGSAPARMVAPEGYRALAHLAFEPDELAALADAAARVRQLGDPGLAADAESAMRKLAFDLPVGATEAPSPERVLAEHVEPKMFASLGKALLDRKVVTFDYHAMYDGKTTAREAEPYGLVFLGAHWYLVARDRGHGGIRNFRLSRMANVGVNRKKSQTADYEIPVSFRLDEHARSREAWNLGDDEASEVIVEFRGATGAVRAAAKLGEPVRGESGRRRFRIRRPDTFARWLLSFGGDAVPVEPAALVDRFRALARATLACYGGAP